jgi:putative SOS response-associated peptidase YedK
LTCALPISATGEVVESYTMLTLNADAHPLMRRMHKPDPALGPDQQDKRSVIPIELEDVDTWLLGSQEDARRLLQLAPADIFQATTASPAAQDAGPAPGSVASPQQGSLL